MIYTCYEMIADCRADRPEGWAYFLVHYVPVIRRFLAHYFQERERDRALIERVLATLMKPDSSLFRSLEPAPERDFVCELRQRVLDAVEADRTSDAPEIAIDLETLSAALEPLTVVEKQAVWFETMRYGHADAGRILRMDPKTVAKIRERASELVRGKLDSWRSTLLADNGPLLGRAAAAQASKECCSPKAFFDMMDGRATWRAREEMERHLIQCWHCVDHFCRLLEVADVLRTTQPLADAEAEPLKKLVGIKTQRPSLWKRLVH